MKAINWTKWSAIAEVLSSVAIVVTLIYLAVQTQQNAAEIRANSRHTMIETDLQLILANMNSPEMWAARLKPELTLEEKVFLEGSLVALLRTREHHWLLFQDGLLDEATWSTYLTGLSGNLSWPRTRAYWDFMKDALFDPGFVDAVDRYLSDTPVRTDLSHAFDRFEN